MDGPDLGPDVKLGEVLDRWPALEQVLLELAPAFRSLRVPVVRKAMGRAATLRQVARAGGVPLPLLLDRLRAAAGLPPAPAPAEPATAAAPVDPPVWARAEPVQTRDARADVAAGEHPLPHVVADLERLREGEVYALVTPFVPAPLLDLARKKGFESFTTVEPGGHARTVFRRAGAPP